MKKTPLNEPFEILDVIVKPGEERQIDLPIPELYTHSHLSMPIHVAHGRTPGPCMFISGAVHGDEINGIEIIRRIMKSPALQRLKGTLIAVPVVNIHGFVNKSRYLPDRRDLNRSFPGSERGSMASKLAHAFMTHVVSRCQYGIDLHTAAIGRDNLPQIRAQVLQDPEVMGMAQAFAAPVILNANLREGSMRQAAREYNSKVLLYEAGEALRFDELSIRTGVKGTLNVMRHIGMLPASRRKKPLPTPAVSDSSRWVRAPQSGIFRSILAMGAKVKKDELMGFIADPFGTAEVEVYASMSGMIVGKSLLPPVYEGEAIFHIAEFSALDDVSEAVENFQNEMELPEEYSEDEEYVIY